MIMIMILLIEYIWEILYIYGIIVDLKFDNNIIIDDIETNLNGNSIINELNENLNEKNKNFTIIQITLFYQHC